MTLHVINSNSSGNAYILENGQEALLIECGVRFEKIKQAFNFNFRKLVGCLLSHEHGDHAKSVLDVLRMGKDVYASAGTHTALNTLGHYRAKVVRSGHEYFVGGFKIKPFDTKHDVAEPLGFLIHHPETGVVLFLTDSYYSEHRFPGLNNIIVEANYCQKILDGRVAAGANPKFLRDRVISSHMSLETCKGMLCANDLSKVSNIVLIHLSDSNSNEDQFKREMEEATGKPVHIAVPGLKIPFNKKPF